MALTYSLSDFKEFENSTQVFLVALGNKVLPLANISYVANTVLSVFGVFINIFHSIILSRKSMINNVINVILLGISICDMLNLIVLVDYSLTMRAESDGFDECAPPKTYFKVVISYYLRVLQDDTRRISSWLGVIMASLRYLILKNALNPRFDFLSRPKFAWKCLFTVIAISTLISSLFIICIRFLQYTTWIPLEKCGFPVNYSQPAYNSYYNEWFQKHAEIMDTYMIADGVLKIAAAAVLPLLTVLLIRQLRIARKFQRKASGSDQNPNKTDYITKMVIIMTITNFLSEAPLGVGFIAEGLVSSNYKLRTIVKNLEFIVSVFLTLNSTSQCFVCLAVSTPYRSAVKELFGYKKSQINISVTPKYQPS